jgi:hypothetical protein
VNESYSNKVSIKEIEVLREADAVSAMVEKLLTRKRIIVQFLLEGRGTCRMSCRISTVSLRRLRDVPYCSFPTYVHKSPVSNFT